MSIIEKTIKQYKDCEKDDELTKAVVSKYLNSSTGGRISDLEELLMNLTTGVNASKINYNLVEEEFNKHRGQAC